MRLVNYFLSDLPEDAELTPEHRRLLEKYIVRQRRLDWFLARTDLAKFMQQIPRYRGKG